MTNNKLLDSNRIDLITVYAASSGALKPFYYDAARKLGEELANAGKSIKYGAGGTGLMGALADGALSRNGKVYGIIPTFLQKLEMSHSGLTDITVVDDMRTRKHLMLENSDAVIALPGGCGTYEELFEAMTLKRLGRWVGPIVLVNTNGFYDQLLGFLQYSIQESFMGDEHLKMWQVVNHPEDVLEALENGHDWGSDALEFANVIPSSA